MRPTWDGWNSEKQSVQKQPWCCLKATAWSRLRGKGDDGSHRGERWTPSQRNNAASGESESAQNIWTLRESTCSSFHLMLSWSSCLEAVEDSWMSSGVNSAESSLTTLTSWRSGATSSLKAWRPQAKTSSTFTKLDRKLHNTHPELC